MSDVSEHDLLLLRLAQEDGGRIDIGRILDRPHGRQSRRSLDVLLKHGLVTTAGYVTPAGRRSLEEWDRADDH